MSFANPVIKTHLTINFSKRYQIPKNLQIVKRGTHQNRAITVLHLICTFFV